MAGGLESRVSSLRRPLVLAHRGASRAAPENSLEALRLAGELGADGVEFDVQACGSGELVVFHDRTLGRCCGVAGEVAATPLAELRRLSLDRLPWGARGQRIPTLEEWLQAVPSGMFVNLEVKAESLGESSEAGRCVQALEQAGLAERALVSSFHPAALWQARRASAGVPRGALVEPGASWRAWLLAGMAAGPRAVHPHHALVTSRRVERWHRLGLTVAVWTVDDPDLARRCLDAGVEAVITNVPDRIRPVVEQYRR